MTQADSIPVSVVVVTRNEEGQLARCLTLLKNFDDIWVVDSNSSDATCDIARAYGAQIVNFTWNGRYPKKYQWCLDTISFTHDFVLFVDADEVLTSALVNEIAALDFRAAGYFICGSYVIDGRRLRFGLKNKKLCLLHKDKMEFPVVDDLDCPYMGEIEGHYQPVLKPQYTHEKVKTLRNDMLHYSCENWTDWERRHVRYARWEVFMDARKAWPREDKMLRFLMKLVFKNLPCRGAAAFMHSYIFKFGFLDGARGYHFAKSRAQYYRMIDTIASSSNIKTEGGAAA